MKVLMINDCAYVGETTLKNLPSNIEGQHIKRTRGLWNKTFGIAYKVLRAKGDIYHINYLLQDCYLALRLGKHPVVGHAHGSDLRTTLKHLVWGRIIRHNLKHCDRIIVSTPDVFGQAKAFREDAMYLPNPVDIELFYPEPLPPRGEKLNVLIASDSNWQVKSTDMAVRALSEVKREVDVSIIRHGRDFNETLTLASSLGLQMTVLPKVPHEKLREYYWKADLIIDRFKLGSMGLISLEAIASGRPAITYVSSEFPEYKDFPLKDINTKEGILDAIDRPMAKLWKAQYSYFAKNHIPDVVVKRLLDIYETLI